MVDESEWLAVKNRFPLGQRIGGVVVRVMDFGVFVRIDGCPAHAVLLVTEFEDGDRSFDLDEYPQVGQPIEGVVVDQVEHNRQLRLSTKESQLGRSRAEVSGNAVESDGPLD